jgi:UDP-N-acetylmuramoyl-tripeptide--D-alanyl-D-alanine ligase
MGHLQAALPESLRAGHAPDAGTLAPMVTAALCPGDVVMVKGSLGSRMNTVVRALLALADGRTETDRNGSAA